MGKRNPREHYGFVPVEELENDADLINARLRVKQTTGEMKLAAATMGELMLDLEAGQDAHRYGGLRQHAANVAYVESNAQRVYGFCWLCDVLGLDESAMRSKLLSMQPLDLAGYRGNRPTGGGVGMKIEGPRRKPASWRRLGLRQGGTS